MKMIRKNKECFMAGGLSLLLIVIGICFGRSGDELNQNASNFLIAFGAGSLALVLYKTLIKRNITNIGKLQMLFLICSCVCFALIGILIFAIQNDVWDAIFSIHKNKIYSIIKGLVILQSISINLYVSALDTMIDAHERGKRKNKNYKKSHNKTKHKKRSKR